jgi:hypothetical protein
MATETPVYTEGNLSAAASMAANQFKAVKITAADTFNLTTVAGEPCLGILQDTPAASRPGAIAILGKCKAKAGAAIAAGARIMAGADGRVITAATATSTCIGWAVEAAAAADNIITVILVPAGVV